MTPANPAPGKPTPGPGRRLDASRIMFGKPPPAPVVVPVRQTRRWVKWTRRVGILLVVLFAIGVAGFTWIAYWPLEGRYQEPLENLVPADVDFLYRANWKDLKATGWVQRNVFDHPLHPSLDPKGLEEGLQAVSDLEGQVNDSLPGALKVAMGIVYGTDEFGVEKDLVPGEVVAAGRLCGGTNPWKDGPPRWRELLLLTKVTGPVRFALAAVGKHEFVRKMAFPPDVTVTDIPGGILRIEARGIRVSDLRSRSGCEGGHVVPPENIWFVARVRDVLVVSNAEDLVAGVLALGRKQGERAVDVRREWQSRPVPSDGISAAVDLAPLRSYLGHLLAAGEAPGSRAGVGEVALGSFLRRFLTADSLHGLTAAVQPEGGDGIRASALLTYLPPDVSRTVADTYGLDATKVSEGIAQRVPDKDTFAIVHMRTPPRALFDALWETLKPADRRLVEDEIRKIGRYASVAAFLDELAGQLGSETGVAFARLSQVFDRVKYETWFSVDDPAFSVAFAVMLRVAPGKRQEDVDAFLSDRVQALGFKAPIPETMDGQVPYSRLEMQLKSRDYELYKPAYCAFNGYLILSTDVEYLKSILKTMRGEEPSVAASARFRQVMGGLPDLATVAAYVNADEGRRVLGDQRNEWVQREKDTVRFANEVRGRLQREAKERGQIPDLAKINDEVDVEVDRYRTDRYAEFIQERLRSIDETKRIAAIGVVLESVKEPGVVLSGELRGGAAVLFQGVSDSR